MTLTVETWIEALESGKYQQGAGQLRDEDCFCCLGVACDLSGEGQWYGDDYYIPHLGLDLYCLPWSVRDILGLRTDLGAFEFESLPADLKNEISRFFGDDDPPDNLSNLNDHGVPFPLIAKVIRARPKGLFREEAQS